MIGSFTYSERPPAWHIVLEMTWEDAKAVGRVHLPRDVALVLQALDMPVRDNNETMNLGIALGYCVSVAALGKVPLTLSGDCSAWPEYWGVLTSPEVAVTQGRISRLA